MRKPHFLGPHNHSHPLVPTAFTAITLRQFAAAALAMAAVVLASNIIVQFPINDWLTWGAITCPLAFLVSELVNRAHGPQQARRVAWVGFAVSVAASLLLAPARLAGASGTAFLLSQWLDLAVFDRLRHGTWWPRCSRPCWTPPCSGALRLQAPKAPGCSSAASGRSAPLEGGSSLWLRWATALQEVHRQTRQASVVAHHARRQVGDDVAVANSMLSQAQQAIKQF